MLQQEAGRLGEPSIGTMGKKLILCCACVVALLTAWGAATAPAQAAKKRTLNKELATLLDSGAIDRRLTTPTARRSPASAGSSSGSPARGAPSSSGAYEVVEGIATRGGLRAARLPPLMVDDAAQPRVLERRAASGDGQRIVFEGSELVWQYVPGEGIHLHPLANFGKLNAYGATAATGTAPRS